VGSVRAKEEAAESVERRSAFGFSLRLQPEDAVKPFRQSRRNASTDSAASSFARTLPHSIEAEEYLLSCCLMMVTTRFRVVSRANSWPVLFTHQQTAVYEKICDLYNRGVPVDLAVLSEELKTSKQLDEIGGYAYLTQISGRIPTTAQAGYFIERLRELYLLRELIRVATGAVENCYQYEGGLAEFIDRSNKIFSASRKTAFPMARNR